MHEDDNNPHTYNDGRLYRLARGHGANRRSYEDAFAATHVVANLRKEGTTAAQMLRLIEREMRIRYYKARSIKAYGSALRQFLSWLGAAPAEANRELLRQYLEMLVDGGASASWVATNLAAIRTAFDKMCGESLTTGLVTPRRRLRPPRVLSREQVISLLSSIASPHHRLLASLIYATGLRISEAIRLRVRDVELDRNQIVVWRGKGGKVRVVPLPDRLRPSLVALSSDPDAFLFRAERSSRHRGPRGLQRALRRAANVANLGQGVTCHTLRHSFATHLLEDGMDIRVIQSLLGHERLETTHIYTHIASVTVSKVRSPFDNLAAPKRSDAIPQTTFRIAPRTDGRTADVTVFLRGPNPVVLRGIEIEEQRPGWLCMRLPPEGDWRRALAALPAETRALVENEDFYERLRNAVASAFVKAKQHR